MERKGLAIASTEIPAPPALAPANPQVQPAPALDQCTDPASFPAADVTVGTNTYSCKGITNSATFLASTTDAQASCALASAAVAMQGKTTGAAIRAYLGGAVPTGGKSFAEFMQDCASHANDTCVASKAVLCSRQLLARAHYDLDASAPGSEAVIKSYADVTQEAYVGQQLAAFKTHRE